MKNIILTAIIAVFSFTSLNTYADDSVETIIVTGTRIPTNISESLSAVSVIQRADIERYQASDIFELLSRVPSVSFTRSGGRGSSTKMALRGNQSDHTLFLIDGVRIGSATSGAATLASLNMSTVERIEVIRGPKSNLYGADAIGGVVNIITRKITEPSAFSVQTSFGSNNTKETSVFAVDSGDRYSLTTTFNTLDSDGIDSTASTAGVNGDKDGFSKDSLALNFHAQPQDNVDWRLVYNLNETDSDYDENCTVGPRSDRSSVFCDIYKTGKVESLSNAIDYKASELWHTSLQLGWSNDESLVAAHSVYSDEALTEESKIDLSQTNNGGEFNTKKTEATWVNNIFLGDTETVTLGVDYLSDEVSGSTNFSEKSRDNKAAFFQYKFQSGDSDIIFGTRRDDNEQFGAHTTTSILAGENISENVRLNFSYGEAFKAPTFNDLYRPFTGNSALKPEQSVNYEIGLNATLGNTFLTIALFHNQLENLIQYNSSFQIEQTAEVDIKGVEFSADTEIAGWDLSVAGSIINPENKANGKLIRRLAEQSVSFNADYEVDNNLAFGFTVRSESHRFNDHDNNVRLGGYSTSSIRASYRLSNEWLVKAKVNNLTDKEYVTSSSSSLGNYLSLGREAMITISYTPSL
jgi:vitamin B12 transporter